VVGYEKRSLDLRRDKVLEGLVVFFLGGGGFGKLGFVLYVGVFEGGCKRGTGGGLWTFIGTKFGGTANICLNIS